MSDSAGHRWRDSRKVDSNNSSSLPVAEPRHRVTSFSSGISFRELPPPSLLQIRKICTHYEQKSAGKYSAKSLAGRYIFQMSREILEQLDRIEGDSKTRERRLQLLETLTKNWEDTFGRVTEDSAITPQQVANQIADLKARLASLQDEMETLQDERAQDSSRFTASLDEQYRVSRDRYHAEVDRLKAVHDEKLQEELKSHELHVGDVIAKQEREIRLLVDKEAAERSKLVALYETELSRASEEFVAVERQLQHQVVELEVSMAELSKTRDSGLHSRYKADIDSLKRSLVAQDAAYQEQVKHMEEGYRLALECEVASIKLKFEEDSAAATSIREENTNLKRRVREMEALLASFQRVASKLSHSLVAEGVPEDDGGTVISVDPELALTKKVLKRVIDISSTRGLPNLKHKYATDANVAARFHRTLRV